MKKTEWYAHPLVSALMVCSDPSRREFSERSIATFIKQKWPHKELIIINSTGNPFFISPIVREFQVKTRFLGEAKNLALYNAEGEWCLTWEDDCLYDEEYTLFHMAQRHFSIPTLMADINAHIISSGHDVLIEDGRFLCVCFPRLMPHVYPQDGNEEVFLANFKTVRKIKYKKPLVTKLFSDEC